VIYTNALKAKHSVILAAIMNFTGVLVGGITVAMGIIHLLPLETIASSPLIYGVCVVLSLLITAIIWNLGTWYLGIPASSSHTLIGSILGVSIAIWYLGGDTPSWGKAVDAGKSLLLSPLIGFGIAFSAMYILHRLAKRREDAFDTPGKIFHHQPDLWNRLILIVSSAWVSYEHGRNDGQKGVGLVLLILMAFLPATFAINPEFNIRTLQDDVIKISVEVAKIDTASLEKNDAITVNSLQKNVATLETEIQASTVDRQKIRSSILRIQKEYKSLSSKQISMIPSANATDTTGNLTEISDNVASLSKATDYAPWWVILMISTSLGLGTMIGWKRIVVTIGEKIGSEKLNFAQATTGAIITAFTIRAASDIGLPVSTTHIMSSSIAGTSSYEHGRHGLQFQTIKNILMAWILTLPITIVGAGLIFLALHSIFL
jgi:inorganic phosphate transporter, PiT family